MQDSRKKKRQEGMIVVRHLQLNFVDILDIKSQMYEKIFYLFIFLMLKTIVV